MSNWVKIKITIKGNVFKTQHIQNYSEVLYIFTYQGLYNWVILLLIYQSSDGSHHCAGYERINKTFDNTGQNSLAYIK